MSVAQSWFLLLCAVAIGWIVYKHVHTGGHYLDPQLPPVRKPPDIVPGLIEGRLLVKILDRSGWRGDFWTKHAAAGFPEESGQ